MSLLTNRHFWPLALTMGATAFIDNLVKNALVVLALYTQGWSATWLPAVAGALFIVPYIFCSTLGGRWADRFDKANMIRALKLVEIGLVSVAAVGFWWSSTPLLLLVLAGLGVQSALFGPAKYAILPQHLSKDQLVQGNGLLEAMTFFSILVGTIVGTSLPSLDHGILWLMGLSVIGSLLGWGVSFYIPSAPPRKHVVSHTSTWDILQYASKNALLWHTILGLTLFWSLGAGLLSLLPAIAQHFFPGNPQGITILLLVFTVGIGLGSTFYSKIFGHKPSTQYASFSLLMLGAALLDMSFALQQEVSFWSIVRVGADIFISAAAGGVLSVPLMAVLQDKAPEDKKAQCIAANNILNAIGMAFCAIAIGFLGVFEMPVYGLCILLSITALLGAVLCFTWFPESLSRFLKAIGRGYFYGVHKAHIHGMEHIESAISEHEGRVVFIANHASFLDAAFLACFLPNSARFAIDRHIAQQWWVKPFLFIVPTFSVDMQNPHAIRHMIKTVQEDRKPLVIFPEGRITRTGSLMKAYDGAGLIAEKAQAAIVSIGLEGFQYTHFSRVQDKLPAQWFAPLRMHILPARLVHTQSRVEESFGRAKRQILGTIVQDLLTEAVFAAQDTSMSLFKALTHAQRLYNKGAILEDIQRTPMSYQKLVRACTILGQKLDQVLPPKGPVGVLLPTSMGGVVAFFALQAIARVPAMLNFSTGPAACLVGCQASGVQTIITSRVFIQKAKLQSLLESLQARSLTILYLEDLRQTLTWKDKLKGLLKRPGTLPGWRSLPEDMAVILFTSGSEGTPKGVALSHQNLLANCAQVTSVLDFTPKDLVLNAMPMFHAFGLTGGILIPLLKGVPSFQYPSPLHYRLIPALIYDLNATITFGTDTFYRGWAKNAHAYDFRSLRFAVAGAEKVQDSTRRLYADKFGVRLLEGYGATETAPVLSLNTPLAMKDQSVGKLLPGISSILENVPGVNHGARLKVCGPNVMLGYYTVKHPGILQPLEEGWYDTGDLVSMDQQGFVSILSRLKRLANLGGEKVSMPAAEEVLRNLWPKEDHAVICVADVRKGEKLIAITTGAHARLKDLLAFAKQNGVADIMVPKVLLHMPQIPMLGVGKKDYPKIQQWAENRLANDTQTPDIL